MKNNIVKAILLLSILVCCLFFAIALFQSATPFLAWLFIVLLAIGLVMLPYNKIFSNSKNNNSK